MECSACKWYGLRKYIPKGRLGLGPYGAHAPGFCRLNSKDEDYCTVFPDDECENYELNVA